MFEQIFKHQLELEKKYNPIERSRGYWTPDWGDLSEFDVDHHRAQSWIKHKCWCVTEEIAEAIFELGTNYVSDATVEELIDALHFLTALSLVFRFDPKVLDTLWCMETSGRGKDGDVRGVSTNAWKTVYQLGLMANQLKNKPWSQGYRTTDRIAVDNALAEAWFSMIHTFLSAGVTDDETLLKYYLNKNSINQKRQTTGY